MPRKTVKNSAAEITTEEAKRLLESRKPNTRKKKAEAAAPQPADALQDVPCILIRPGNNDRKHFDENALNELAESIKANGLAQPITVRPIWDAKRRVIDFYQIVAGERRFRAISQVLGWDTVRAIVRELSDEDAAAIMLVENTSRVDLDPIAEANAYRVRIEQFAWSHAQVAEAAGVSVERVRNRLALLELADDVQHYVKIGSFPQGHALLLSGLDKDRQRIALRAYNTAKHMPVTRFKDVVAKLVEQQEAESQISMFDLELLIVSEVESDAITPLRGKGARTGAPVNVALPPVRVSGRDGVGDILDRYIQTLLNVGQPDAAAAIGTIYTALVSGNWVSVPAGSVLAKTAETAVAAGDAVQVEKL